MNDSKDYFRTICNISRAFGTAKANQELLQLIVNGAVETMNAKAAALFLDEPGLDHFKSAAQYGLSDKYLHADPGRARHLTDKLMKDGYLSIYDAQSDPSIQNRELKKAEGIASILVVPVMVKGDAIGVLSLYTDKPRTFTTDEIDFLSALAEQGGMAITNGRLLGRIRRNSKLFLDIAANINSSLDIKQILHILTADISEALGMKGATIRLLDNETGTLEVVASYGLSESFIKKEVKKEEKIVAQNLQGNTVFIKDINADDRIQDKQQLQSEGIASLFSVPICSANNIIGIMRLFSDTIMESSEEMIMLVNALANQGGLAIQNASLYLKLKEDKESLEKDIWSHRLWF